MVNKIETGLEKTELYLGMLINILDGDDKDVYFMERADIREKLNFIKSNVDKYSAQSIEGYCGILSNRVTSMNSDLKQIILDNLELTNLVNVHINVHILEENLATLDGDGNYITYHNGKVSSCGDFNIAKYQLERMAMECSLNERIVEVK